MYNEDRLIDLYYNQLLLNYEEQDKPLTLDDDSDYLHGDPYDDTNY